MHKNEAMELLKNNSFDLLTPAAELESLTPIAFAAKYGVVEYLRRNLVGSGPQEASKLLSQTNAGGLTPLHFACLNGQITAVEVLIEHGASVLSSTALGLLPIHLIFSSNNDKDTLEELFKLLPEKHTWITKKNRNNDTLAHLAAERGSIEILRIIQTIQPELLQEKNNYLIVPLLTAVISNQPEAVSFLLENTDFQQKNSRGQNALHVAVLSATPEMVRSLLPFFDCNERDNENHTPLDLAKRLGYQEKEEILAAHQNVRVEPSNGLTPS